LFTRSPRRSKARISIAINPLDLLSDADLSKIFIDRARWIQMTQKTAIEA